MTGMAEYIDRDHAIREACREICGCEPSECEFDKPCAIVERYKKWPAANVRENVTGRWIWDDEGYHCSECLYHAYGNTGEVLTGQFIYCPWCGAKLCEEED